MIGIQILLMISCSSDEDIEFIIEISEDTNITENDIEFYDSSTCILFLKEPINFQYRFGDIPNVSYEDFAVKINSEVIFSGIFYPEDVAEPSPTSTFIGCFDNDSLASDVIEFKFSNFPNNSDDKRRSEELINFFEKNNLLRNGVSLSINKIEPSSSNDSSLNIVFRITNNDNNVYQIPDPTTMNAYQLLLLTGGACIRNIETDGWVCKKFEINPLDEMNFSNNNLCKLPGNDEIQFTTTFKYDSNFNKGLYTGEHKFRNKMHQSFVNFDLNHMNGRIWIGEMRTNFDFEIN